MLGFPAHRLEGAGSRGSRGVSLVEIAVMVVVIGILSLVMFSSLTAQQIAVERAAIRRAAIAACQSHIDRSLATQYASLVAIKNDASQNRWTDTVDGVAFTSVRTIVEKTHLLNLQKYLEITVTTEYPTMTPGDTVVMTTIISRTEG